MTHEQIQTMLESAKDAADIATDRADKILCSDQSGPHPFQDEHTILLSLCTMATEVQMHLNEFRRISLRPVDIAQVHNLDRLIHLYTEKLTQKISEL